MKLFLKQATKLKIITDAGIYIYTNTAQINNIFVLKDINYIIIKEYNGNFVYIQSVNLFEF